MIMNSLLVLSLCVNVFMIYRYFRMKKFLISQYNLLIFRNGNVKKYMEKDKNVR